MHLCLHEKGRGGGEIETESDVRIKTQPSEYRDMSICSTSADWGLLSGPASQYFRQMPHNMEDEKKIKKVTVVSRTVVNPGDLPSPWGYRGYVSLRELDCTFYFIRMQHLKIYSSVLLPGLKPGCSSADISPSGDVNTILDYF